ncbi:hypothetical protein SUDANB132_03642 [Streptomyces sp. enrichment culture]
MIHGVRPSRPRGLHRPTRSSTRPVTRRKHRKQGMS